MRYSRFQLLALFVVAQFVLFGMELRAADAPIPDKIVFNRDIRPILSDTCFHCHGPDKNARKAGLRLDLREEALKPADSGETPLVPGKPEKSEVARRVLSSDAVDQMPPPQAHKPLSSRQKELLKRWIAQGAEYQQHWAYLPIQRPAIPRTILGKPAPAHPVDALIRERLARENLPPAPETDKATLIRRVTLDLTGLPPTPAEVDAFVSDTASGAYERVVDRLLNSPRYGERMAVDWLDAARYADTNGYQVDRDRMAYAWRDWVIRAFNGNMRFDQFTIEQIAGDLLPKATFDQRIATGFHRNHIMNEEGGIIPEEFLAEYTADRVETTATIWLGQTFNCTRCHDHKFDPFTQHDFYGMKAFFHNVSESGVGDYSKPSHLSNTPFVKLPSPEIDAKLAAVQRQIDQTKGAQARFLDDSPSEIEDWTRELRTHPVSWKRAELQKTQANFIGVTILPESRAVRLKFREDLESRATLVVKAPGRRVTALRVRCAQADRPVKLKWSEVRLSVAGLEGKPQLLKLYPVEAGRGVSMENARKLVDGLRRTSTDVTVAEKQSVDAVFELEEPLEAPERHDFLLDVGIEIESASDAAVYQVDVTSDCTDGLVSDSLEALARREPSTWSAAERQAVAKAYVSKQPEYRELVARLAGFTSARESIENAMPTALVMDELAKPRDTFVLMRGEYDKPGAKVTATTPAVLPPMRKDLPLNRLGLARWLVDPENPLPARVTVNRLWQMLFGAGLVRTVEDFGSQGEPPSHSELIDWLASEFISSGWNVKATLRLLVTSETYRQSSRTNAVLQERDHENRLLARGPRFRLQGEFIRDQALSVSGLLASKLGGPSVKPYHPPGMYEQVTAGTGTNVYVQGKADELHRRSLYTYWKRSVPHPAMLLFDAPFRETCTLRRPRTNTPLQSLNLLNDPTYVEAARGLAQRMILEGGQTIESRLTFAFRVVLARSPRPAEVALLRVAWNRALQDFEKDSRSAAEFLKVGDTPVNSKIDPAQLAALTTIASTLLNLDEAITKE